MREVGLYWVRWAKGEPAVAHWNGTEWWLDDNWYPADEPEVLSDRLIPPGHDQELTLIMGQFIRRARVLLDGARMDAKGDAFSITIKPRVATAAPKKAKPCPKALPRR